MRLLIAGGHGVSGATPGVIELCQRFERSGRYTVLFAEPKRVTSPSQHNLPRIALERAAFLRQEVERFQPNVVVGQSADALSVMILAQQWPETLAGRQVILTCPAGIYRDTFLGFVRRIAYRWAADHLLAHLLDNSISSHEYRTLSRTTRIGMRSYERGMGRLAAWFRQVIELNTNLTLELLKSVKLEQPIMVVLGVRDRLFEFDRSYRALKKLDHNDQIRLISLDVTHAFYRHVSFFLGQMSCIQDSPIKGFPVARREQLAEWWLRVEEAGLWFGSLSFVAAICIATLGVIACLP